MRNAAPTAVRLLTAALTFITGIFVARLLGPSGRGFVQLIPAYALLVSSIGGFSVELGMAQLFARNSAKRDDIVSTISRLSWLWGGALGLVSLFMLMIPQTNLRRFGTAAGLCLGVVSLAMLVETWLQRAFLLQNRALMSAGVPLLDACLSVIFIIAVAQSLNPVRAVIAGALGSLLAAAIATWLVRSPSKRVSPSIARNVLAMGIRFHPGQVALAALIRIDIIILAALGGLAETGLYSVSVSLTAPLAILATGIASTYLNDQLSGDMHQGRLVTIRMVRIIGAVTFITCLFLASTSWWLIPRIWGTDFSDAYLPLVLILPGSLATALQRPIGAFMVREGNARELNARAIGAAILNVVLCLALIPSTGAAGAAAASSVAYIVYAIMSVTFFARSTGIRMGRFAKEILGAT